MIFAFRVFGKHYYSIHDLIHIIQTLISIGKIFNLFLYTQGKYIGFIRKILLRVLI